MSSDRGISAGLNCAGCSASPRAKLDEFLTAHDVFGIYTLDDLERDREDLAAIVPDEESRARARQAAANIIARRKGVSLGGLSIKGLINEGRR
jgi:hypothetical protein